jgi:hypothetical protein
VGKEQCWKTAWKMSGFFYVEDKETVNFYDLSTYFEALPIVFMGICSFQMNSTSLVIAPVIHSFMSEYFVFCCKGISVVKLFCTKK